MHKRGQVRGRALGPPSRSLQIGEQLSHLGPRADTRVARLRRVVRRGEQHRTSLEPLEMPRAIVNEVVRIDDALVAAEDQVRGGNEGEVPAEPTVFRVK